MTMHALVSFLAGILSLFGGHALGDSGLQTLPEMVSTTTPSAITQRVYGKPLKITGLTTGSVLCLGSNGLATTTGCSGGGGSGTISTSSALSAGLLVKSTGPDTVANIATSSLGLLTTNVAEGTNKYYTDARARAALSLTTTGSSGAATYDNTSGVLNVPQYSGGASSTVLSDNNTFTGSNMLLASTTVGNGTQAGGLTISGGATTTGSIYTSNALRIGYTATYPYSNSGLLAFTNGSTIAEQSVAAGGTARMLFQANGNRFDILNQAGTQFLTSTQSNLLQWYISGVEKMRIDSSGNVGIGTTSPYTLLSVAGDIVGTNITAAGTITQTKAATSTFAGGITAPCFSTDGTNCITGTGGASGTVTSVAATVPTGLTVTGSPVTTSGTLAFAWDTGYSPVLTASSTNWNSAYNSWNTNNANWTSAYTNRITSVNNDTNVTGSISGNALTLGWTGTLADSRIASASTWSAKQDAITLTTTGSSGAATFSGGMLNIPQYAAGTTYTATYPITLTGSAFGTDISTSTLLSLSAWYATTSKPNLATVGTITSGTWQGTAIADTYIASASTWNAKAGTASPTFTGTVNGAGLIFNASSTVGDGTQTGGLTVSGGATTTGNAYFAGSVGIGGQPGTSILTINTGTPTGVTDGWQFGSDNSTRTYRNGAGGITTTANWTFNNNVTINNQLTASQFVNSSNAGVGISSGTVSLQTANTQNLISGVFNGDTVISPARTTGVAGLGNVVIKTNGTTALTVLNTNQNVGVGTTSPGTLFSIGNTTGWNFIDNGTTTSRAKGIDLEGGGCFAVGGTCLTSGGSGTVTSVGGTGAVNGLTLTGTVTTSGNLTLGGTLAINNGDWSGTQLAIANGGTGLTAVGASSTVATTNGTSVAWQKLDLTAGVYGTLPIANGGTGITSFGTGVATALGTNVGSAGAFVTFNGALGTPSSGTLTNATGLPVSSGVSGLGTGIATWLGTPSSANLATAMTTKTGTAGSLVFSVGPTFTGKTTLAAASTTDLTAGSSNYAVNPLNAFPIYMASSTWGAGTTTITLLNNARAITIVDNKCNTSAGTLWIDIYYSSTHLNLLSASTTANTFVYSTNNVIAPGNTIKMDVGTAASSPTNVNCTLEYTYNGSS